MQNNPFYILGATTRDNRNKILELAEEKSLEIDEELCSKARSNLTIPKNRLEAELTWFPGLSPKRIKTILEQLVNAQQSILEEVGLPTLSECNLLIAILNMENFHLSKEQLKLVIEELIEIYDALDIKIIIRDINEDRALAGFVEVRDETHVEEILIQRKNDCTKNIIKRLNGLEIQSLIQLLTTVVEDTTLNGEKQPNELVELIVDDYMLHTKNFLEQEAQKIKQLMEAIELKASLGKDEIKSPMDRLIQAIRTWDNVAQPIQLCYKPKGINDALSQNLGHSVRSFGINLFNQYNLLDESEKIIHIVKELFSELPDLANKLEEDVVALQEISIDREKREKNHKDFLKSLSYSTEIGIVFKDKLTIANGKITFNNITHELENITKIAWGAMRHSVNGIPTGTTYTIRYGNTISSQIIETRRSEVYENVIDKLWRSSGVDILTTILKTLKEGKSWNFSKCILWDDGITFTKKKFFGSDETIKVGWNGIKKWSENGCLVLDTEHVRCDLSYMDIYNVHFLEHLISMLFKNNKVNVMSDLL